MDAYAIGILGVVGLTLAWVGVQRAWARSFPEAFDDPDVLAGRGGCDGCGCTKPCTSDTSEARQR
jgi:hypothetical protein